MGFLKAMKNQRAWLNLGKAAEEIEQDIPEMYHRGYFLVEIINSQQYENLMKDYSNTVLLESKKRAGQPGTTMDIEQTKMAEHCIDWIHDWQDVCKAVEIPKKEWEELKDDEKYPKKEPRFTKKFYKYVPMEFNRKALNEVVNQHLALFVNTLFLTKGKMHDMAEEIVYEGELKN